MEQKKPIASIPRQRAERKSSRPPIVGPGALSRSENAPPRDPAGARLERSTRSGAIAPETPETGTPALPPVVLASYTFV